jgi:general secretion pathway protein B
MSFLLEALRKSEEQKRRGEVPSIHTAVPQRNVPSRTGLLQVAIVVLLLIVIAWLTWRTWLGGEETILDSRNTKPAIVEAQVEPQSASTQPQSATAQPQSQLQLPPSRIAGPPASTRTPVEKFEGDTESWSTSAPVDNGVAAVIGSDSNTVATLPAQEDIARLAGSINAVGIATSDDSEPDQEAGETMVPHVSETVSFWALPDSVRERVPGLRMSVLVYAQEPEDRFVLINGERLVEGDEVVSGLAVDEIRRDGVVFQYEYYRFLLKR